jgi:cytidylate kinase
MGSGGRIIAGKVAESLGWRMIGREVVIEAARQTGFDEAKLERVFERRVSLEDRLTFQQRSGKYLGAINAVVIELAMEGNVVILGRGAGVILCDEPNIFRVHLVADLDTRIDRIAGQFGLKGEKGREEARHRVLDSDYARSAYHTYLFDADWNDPLLYDLVVNTGDLDLDQAAGIVLEAFRIMEKGA